MRWRLPFIYNNNMKTISLAILAALALGSCTKDDTAPVQSAKDNRTLSVVATTESASRAVLYEGESAAQVVWEADDKIGVFTMSNKATAPNNCLHIVQGGSTTARFAGQMQNEVQHNDSYFAYYPYDGRTEFYYDSDQSIVLNAPRVQYRRSEGFDARSCGFMVAKSKTGILYGDEPEFAFKNLFAILKFTLTGAGERLYRINVFDNNGGQMSGQFFVSMTDANLADPTPTFEGGGFYTAPFDSEYVTLGCNTVLSDTPQSFYVAVPPRYYTYGYSVEFETSAGAMFRSNGTLTGKTLKRNTIYRHPQEKFAADYDITLRATADYLWQSSANTLSNIALRHGAAGTDLSLAENANCYIVDKAGDYSFRASRPDGVALWGASADAYISFSISEETIQKGGNALIALFDDEGNVLWSWHIWIPRENSCAALHSAGGTHSLMSLNLGALCSDVDSADSYGFYYQWGRKDPFVGNGSAGETASGYRETTPFETVACVINPKYADRYSFRTIANNDSAIATGKSTEYATAHPTTFIYYNANVRNGDSSGEDTAHLQSGSGTWFNSYYAKFVSLWGYEHGTRLNRKTIYDPCPAGYRVPDCVESTWTGMKAGATVVGSLGGLMCDGSYYPAAGCRDGWGTAGKGGCLRYSGYNAYYMTSRPSTNYCDVLSLSYHSVYSLYPASAGVVRCIKQ